MLLKTLSLLCVWLAMVSGEEAYEQQSVTVDAFVGPTDVLLNDNNIDDWPDLPNYPSVTMHLAWEADNPVLSTIYLRYDCYHNRMYFLVLVTDGLYMLPPLNEFWIKLGDLIVVTGEVGNSQVLYMEDGTRIYGWEGFFPLDEGDNYEFRAHVGVYYNNELQTSGTSPSPKTGLSVLLSVECLFTLTGYVYHDCDGSMTFDEGESPLHTQVQCKNLVDGSVRTVWTIPETGFYSCDVRPGNYEVTVLGPIPEGFTNHNGGVLSPVTVNDDTTGVDFPYINPPTTLTCPPDQTVLANENGVAIITYGPATGEDACGSYVGEVASFVGPDGFTGAVSSGSPFPIGVTTLTFEAQDTLDRILQCSTVITVVDDSPPVLGQGCPDISQRICALDCCDYQVVTYETPIASDNSGTVEVSCDHVSGTKFYIGTTLVTCTATDPAGLTASCSFDVVVDDCTDPTCTPPEAVNRCHDDVEPYNALSLSDFVAVGNDNSGNFYVTSDPDVNEYPLGTTTVDFTVTDGAGNTATCSSTVTVKDCRSPLCFPIIDRLDAMHFSLPFDALAPHPVWYTGNAAEVTLSWSPDASLLAEDNSGFVEIAYTVPASPQNFSPGEYTIEVYYADQSPDSDDTMCSIEIGIKDNFPPQCDLVVTPPDCANLANLGEVYSTSTTLATSPASWSFSCSDNVNPAGEIEFFAEYQVSDGWVNIEYAHLLTKQFSIGTHTVRVWGVDKSGNPSEKEELTFTVRDCESPICTDPAVDPPCATEATTDVLLTPPVCEDFSNLSFETKLFVNGQEPFVILHPANIELITVPVGTHRVEWSATDNLNLPTIKTATFTVLDCGKPVCSIQSKDGCANVGDPPMTADVHVVNLNFGCSDNVEVTEVFVYECPSELVPIEHCTQVALPKDGWTFGFGFHYLRVWATDAAGNLADLQSTTFEVLDCVPPQCEFPQLKTEYCADEQPINGDTNADSVFWGSKKTVTWDIPEVSCTDASELEIVTKVDGQILNSNWGPQSGTFGLGGHSIEVVVTDGSTHSADASWSHTFIIKDCGNPYCNVVPNEASVSSNDDCQWDVDLSAFQVSSSDDNDPSPVLIPPTEQYVTDGAELQWKVTDATGNVGYCTATVTVNVEPASIEGTVFHDLSEDAIYNPDWIEPGVDTTVSIYYFGGGAVTDQPDVQTGVDGTFAFTGLDACQAYEVLAVKQPRFSTATTNNPLSSGHVGAIRPELFPGETRLNFNIGFINECVVCEEGTSLRCVEDQSVGAEPMAKSLFELKHKSDKRDRFVKHLVRKK